MRFFLTDLRGNPIYSFAHARRLRRSASNTNLNNNNNNNNNNTITNNDTLQQGTPCTTRRGGFGGGTHQGTTSSPSDENNSFVSTPTAVMSTTLFCMIKNRAWDDVIVRVQKYPSEVCGQEPMTGNTALHIACRLDPPPGIIYALHRSCRIPNADGATPLHIAASHRCSAASLDALLTVSSSSGITSDRDYNDAHTKNNMNDTGAATATADLSRMGRAPIHYACMSFRGLEIDAFRILLDATLRDGNIWMEKPESSPPPLLYQGRCSGLSSFHKFDIEDDFINEEDDDLSLENEIEKDPLHNDFNVTASTYDDRDKYMNADDDYQVGTTGNHQSSTTTSMDLTDKDDKYQGNDDTIKCRTTCTNKVLVNVMCLKDATGQTPLALLFRRYRERVRRVITTLDRLRRELYEHDPHQMALSAALTVHSDLGQLWEKARFIVARLTEERIAKDSEGNKDSTKLSSQSLSDTNQREEIGTEIHSLVPSSASIAVQHYHEEEALIAAKWSTEKNQNPRFVTLGSYDSNNSNVAYQRNLEETVTIPSDEATAMTTIVTDDTTSKSEIDNNSDAAVGGVTIGCRQFRIVHASVGLTGYGCPPELIRLAISMYPHQVMEMDEDGNLPIHIAVSAASHLAPAMVAALEHHHNQQHQLQTGSNNSCLISDDHSIISDAALSFFSSATVSQTTNPFDKVIKMLLHQYPDAARIPHGKNGQLPLVLAVESGRRTWEDGLRTLLNAYPPALHNKKLIDSAFYPNILAMIANSATGYYSDYTASSSNCFNNINNYNNNNEIVLFDFLPLRRSHMNTTTNKPRQTKQQRLRHQACALTTLFDLLRTKPEWITKGYEE